MKIISIGKIIWFYTFPTRGLKARTSSNSLNTRPRVFENAQGDEDLEMLEKSEIAYERTPESQCAFKNFQSTSSWKYYQSTST